MKKVLVIDDQTLVTITLKKIILEFGLDVISCNDIKNAIIQIDEIKFDLIILDINLDEDSIDGFDLIQKIKLSINKNTPVFVLSGQVDDDSIHKAYELGIVDFIKKPISKIEIQGKLANFFKQHYQVDLTKLHQEKSLIHDTVVGVVIPCYNEGKRLKSEDFIKFIDSNVGYKLCFVNDGSKDNTLQVLLDLQKGKEDFIYVYDCQKNGGKAEAVRLGMKYLACQKEINYVGFLDADLSTNFADFVDLVKTIKNSNFKIVSGSRMSRMGANISKDSARAIISLTINYIIRKTLGMDFNDTQCGAKVMTKDVVIDLFNEPFYTKWLFDVEIFMRMRKKYGLEKAKQFLCEQPLKRWEHVDGSKLSFKDSISIVGQIFQIAIKYR